MKAKEIRDMDEVEIAQKLDSFKQELFNLRFQQSTGEIENPLRIREVRKNIARIKTIIHERQIKKNRA